MRTAAIHGSAELASGVELLNALECGGQGRNRTADASLFRAALYQLSYLARDKFDSSRRVTPVAVRRASPRSRARRSRAGCCRARPWSRWLRNYSRADATSLREFRTR